MTTVMLNREDWPKELVGDLIDMALAKAVAGQSSPELKLLQSVPYRDYVNWLLFPPHFRPSNPEDYEGCCHEG